MAPDAYMPEKVTIPSEPTPHQFIRPPHSCLKAPSRRQTIFSGGPGYRYIRSAPNTPTHAAFVEKICSLEGGQAGLAFSSGMAAETRCFSSLLKSGDHLLSTNIIYGGTFGLISSFSPRFGIEVSFVDTTDQKLVKASMRENTKMIFLETPANPTMAVSDISELSKIAKRSRSNHSGR